MGAETFSGDKVLATHVQGMTCRPCEDTILERLYAVRGVIRAEVSYWKAEVRVTYDPGLVTEERLRGILAETGYPTCDSAHGGIVTEILTAVAAILLCVMIPLLPLPEIPAVQVGASLMFLFWVGIITGTHCMCMCGGIMFGAISPGDGLNGFRDIRNPRGSRGLRSQAIAPFLFYQIGRLAGCMILGGLFGAIGTIFSYSAGLRSAIYLLCGLAVLFIALCTWGIFPALRRIQAQLPAICKIPVRMQKLAGGKPILIGALNSLLPCAASSAMWLYAASTGSAVRGCLAMLVWCLGTMPVMGIFAAVGSLLPARGLRAFERVGVVLMLCMGVLMIGKGM